jgi:hypothetical protein
MAMRVVAILVGFLAACAAQDDGTPITGCETCGSGAVRAGIVFSGQTPLVTASSTGTSAYTTDGSELVWLGSDFQITGSTSIEPPSYASPGEIRGLYSDAAGETYVYAAWPDDIDEYESEIGFGADHHQLFASIPESSSRRTVRSRATRRQLWRCTSPRQTQKARH